MGDREKIGGTNGDSPPPLSTHLVEVIDVSLADESVCERAVEMAYTRLNTRAKNDDSIILSVVQTASTYVLQNVPCLTVVLTAQRISREDLERQQRAMQLTGGPRR